MPDLLIYGDTIRSPELRHEVPVPVPDAFVYAEKDGARYVFVGSLEIPRIEGLNGIVTVPLEDLGIDELYSRGLPWYEAERELVLRACRKIGVEDAVTPRGFPLDAADHLRASGIALKPQGELFDERRRVKNEAELAGIRRAQAAAQNAMGKIRDRLREGDVTCEDLQAIALRSFSEDGVIAPDMVIVSHGEQTAIGHEPGHGPISEGEAVIADLYPQDPVSGCYADMTRTFCMGEPPEELVRYHALVKEALDRGGGRVRPGSQARSSTDDVRSLRRARLPDAADKGSRASRSRTGSSTASATASGSRCTSFRASDAWAPSSSPAMCSPSSRASTARASAAAGSRTSCSSPTTAARS